MAGNYFVYNMPLLLSAEWWVCTYRSKGDRTLILKNMCPSTRPSTHVGKNLGSSVSCEVCTTCNSSCDVENYSVMDFSKIRIFEIFYIRFKICNHIFSYCFEADITNNASFKKYRRVLQSYGDIFSKLELSKL